MYIFSCGRFCLLPAQLLLLRFPFFLKFTQLRLQGQRAKGKGRVACGVWRVACGVWGVGCGVGVRGEGEGGRGKGERGEGGAEKDTKGVHGDCTMAAALSALAPATMPSTRRCRSARSLYSARETVSTVST